MKTFVLIGSLLTLSVAALAVAPAAYQRGPKNLMSPTYRAPAASVTAPQELTKKAIKKLEVTAETAAEHTRIANFYQGEAIKLEAKAVAYEGAAAALRIRPVAKNLGAPGASARWEFEAKGFREDAASNRAAGVAHQKMAADVFAGF